MTETAAPAEGLTITESAARRIAVLMKQEGAESSFLRIGVAGGGCSGFQYTFDFDQELGDEDRVFERDGVRVVVDTTSLDLMQGAQLDFVEDLIGSAFQISNPNAQATCGCGSSFAVG